MPQFDDDPAQYLRLMRERVPLYDRLQSEVVAACVGVRATRILDLGAGTGETSRRCLEINPTAALVALDANAEMLSRAADVLGERAELRVGCLEDPLPEGQFDLVISALAAHHLSGPAKAELFVRVAACLGPGGRFVLGDVVITDESPSPPTPLDPKVDHPDRVADLIGWLAAAGLQAELRWAGGDLAVIAATGRSDS